MNVHTYMPIEVNIIFVDQPLDPRGGGLGPQGHPRSSRYFGLPMVNLRRQPYHQTCLILGHLTTLNMRRILTQMFMLEFLRLPLEQMVKHKMHKLLIYLVLPS